MDSQINLLLDKANQVILGKQHEIRLALCCLISQGHLLIEDIPGVGKTTLAHTIAKLLGLQYQRIQFTSDILPADIIGGSVFDANTGQFTFHQGPLFQQMVLADEINRSTPKAQSALLEAMEERQVSVEGVTYTLPEPFFVIATQNPSHQIGTYPLPESQLDRFMMRIELGYPNAQAEKELLSGKKRYLMINELAVQLAPEQLLMMQQQAAGVHAAAPLIDYLQGILHFTRESADFASGLSPRAGLAILTAAKSWAFMEQRDSVLPEDIQVVLAPVAAHRLRPELRDAQRVVAPILNQVNIP